jgi:dipeptidyl aminopeptidase/acylaminoacyl peptidase
LLTAGYGEWGGKMQTDVSDGVRELVKQGVVDPARVCIAGASYGGYAALAAATLDPDPYRCVVSVSGISDVRRMLDDDVDNQVYEENAVQRYDMRLLGVKSMNEPRVREVSPLFHIDRVKAPVLLIHGVDDTVVKYEQSQLMANALRAAGKPVEFVTLKAEDHWLSRGETRLQMLQAMMKFVEANNPPDPPKPEAAKAATR